MIDNLSLRELQLECSRAMSVIEATNNNISQFNKLANHNSQQWYKAVIQWYVNKYGDLPSRIGPGQNVKLIYNV